MPASLAVWPRLVVAGFRRQSHYRLAMIAGVLTNIVFGFIRAALLLAALHSAGGSLAGYSTGSIGAYVWLSQGLIGAIELGMTPTDIGDRIRTGDVAVDFIRPVDIQASYLAADIGRAACTLIPRGVPSVLIGALTFGLVMPGTPLPYVLGTISVVLAVTVSFLCRYAVNILGFWVVETRGARALYMVCSTFLAGLYVPVYLFPGWLHAVAQATPFPSILQTPIDVLSGRVTGLDAIARVGVQLGWVLVVCLIGRALTFAGRRKLEVQGG